MAKLSIAQLTSLVATYVAGNKISVDSFSETRDNSVLLLDTLGKIYTLWQNYGDKLALFDRQVHILETFDAVRIGFAYVLKFDQDDYPR